MISLVACGGPNFDNPKTVSKILAQAVSHKALKKRESGQGKLVYSSASAEPYTGWSKKMYANAKVDALIQYKDGKMDGLWVGWYKNGQMKWRRESKNGLRHGEWIGWNIKAKVIAKGDFSNGNGLWILWHNNGQKWWEGNYVNNYKSGVWTSWHENGEKREHGEYKNNKRVGKWTEWNEKGHRIAVNQY